MRGKLWVNFNQSVGGNYESILTRGRGNIMSLMKTGIGVNTRLAESRMIIN